MQTESGSSVYDAFAGFQDSSPVKSPLRKKSTFQGSFHHDDDYQFTLAVHAKKVLRHYRRNLTWKNSNEPSRML